MAAVDLSTRPGADEHFKYIRGFLLTLALCFGVIGAILVVYDTMTASRAAEAQAALGDNPDADAMKKAFELIESPHLFSGWRVPERVLPKDDRILGDLDEEALAAAVIAAPDTPIALAQSKDAGKCNSDLLCIATSLGKPWDRKRRLPNRVKIFNYLLARRSMAKGEPLTDGQLTFMQWNRTLWIRAFRRQIMDGKGTPTATDAAMLRPLIENLEGASKNGLIFGWYGVVSGLLFGLILLVWIKRRRPEDAEGPAHEPQTA